jgi:hypothetical protein
VVEIRGAVQFHWKMACNARTKNIIICTVHICLLTRATLLTASARDTTLLVAILLFTSSGTPASVLVRSLRIRSLASSRDITFGRHLSCESATERTARARRQRGARAWRAGSAAHRQCDEEPRRRRGQRHDGRRRLAAGQCPHGHGGAGVIAVVRRRHVPVQRRGAAVSSRWRAPVPAGGRPVSWRQRSRRVQD